MGKGIVKLGEGQWAVKDGNLLAAKETNGRFKNTEFSVSRGTRASYVGRDGLIKESNLQDVNLVNNGDFSELGSELVTNGDFGNGTIGWSSGNSTLSVVDGKLKVLAINAFSYARQDITVASGKTYKITANFFYNSLVGNIEAYDGTTNTISEQLSEDGVITLYVTPSSTNLRLTLLNRNGSSGDFNYWDNVSIKEVDPNDYWTVTDSDSNNYVEFTEGFARLKFLNTSPITTLSSTLTLEANKTYKLIVDVHDVTSGSIKIDAAGISELFNAEGVTTRYIKPTGNTTLSFYRATSNVDVTLASVSAQEVKTDTPRIDFTDNTDGHLLLEPQSTNLITYSEDFEDSSWTKGRTEVSPNTTISPNGSLNASTLSVVNATGGEEFLRKISSDSSAATTSIYVKKGNWRYITIRSVNINIFDFDTETFTLVGTNEVVSFEKLQNGWYRLKASSPTRNYCSVGFANSATNVNGTNVNGSYMYIWGAQLEALSHPTSYIPTNGSTVTRDAETCTGAGSSADFNSEEGVLYAEIAKFQDDNDNFVLLSLNNSSDNLDDNTVTIGFDSDDDFFIRVQANNVNVFYSNDQTSSKDVYYKIALSYKSGDSKIYINGNPITPNFGSLTGTFSFSSILDNLSFDYDGNGVLPFYGRVKALRVYKEALSDTDLQNLTS